MQMFCFKFQQNRNIYIEFYFFRGGWIEEGGGNGTPFLSLISIVIGKHMKMFFVKFLGAPRGAVDPITKIRKGLIQKFFEMGPPARP